MLQEVTDRPSARAPGTAPSRTEQAAELSVFLFLVVPSLVLSLFIVQQGSTSFPLVAIATILRDLALVCLVWFFLWRNGEPLVRIGWTDRHMVREVLIGVVLFIPVYFGAAALDSLLESVGLSGPAKSVPSFLHERGPMESVLAVALVTVVAVSEETIFRGYLLLRLTATLRSTLAALVLSSVIFAVGHGYEGSAGVITVGTMGFAFAVVYLWRGSLVAPIVMHFLQDFLAIVLAPLLVQQ